MLVATKSIAECSVNTISTRQKIKHTSNTVREGRNLMSSDSSLSKLSARMSLTRSAWSHHCSLPDVSNSTTPPAEVSMLIFHTLSGTIYMQRRIHVPTHKTGFMQYPISFSKITEVHCWVRSRRNPISLMSPWEKFVAYC